MVLPRLLHTSCTCTARTKSIPSDRFFIIMKFHRHLAVLLLASGLRHLPTVLDDGCTIACIAELQHQTNSSVGIHRCIIMLCGAARQWSTRRTRRQQGPAAQLFANHQQKAGGIGLAERTSKHRSGKSRKTFCICLGCRNFRWVHWKPVLLLPVRLSHCLPPSKHQKYASREAQ